MISKLLLCVIVTVMLLLSSGCSTYSLPFNFKHVENLNETRVLDAIQVNELQNYLDITPNYPVTVGEGIYPNNENFKLDKLISIRRNFEDFDIDVDYRFTRGDSLLKNILYEWNYKDDSNTTKKQKRMKKLYLDLVKRLNSYLGEPTKIEDIENVWRFENGSGFRISNLWLNDTKFNAYLFMLGNDDRKYYRIRLSIYQR